MVHRYCGLTSTRLSGETHGARSRREGVGESFVRALAGTPEMRQQVLAGLIAGRRHGLRSSVKRAVSIGDSMRCLGLGAGGAHLGCMRHQPRASRRKPGRRQARGRVRLRSGRQPLGAQGRPVNQDRCAMYGGPLQRPRHGMRVGVARRQASCHQRLDSARTSGEKRTHREAPAVARTRRACKCAPQGGAARARLL